ncbi:serine hydrolase [Phytomonospora endophytica]|uniref:Beta-lactamase class A n=1 Tax=Phytomonospora endophytica TaxID=714109 RepID=A0A841FHF1_9ACTN|nr:serine hydrolase [Phytomonospora endophytica]MBB6035646.1 beta-lactamase class A [Phytomonospora endophytica]
MAANDAFQALEPAIAALPGTVSVWCGRLEGEPAYTRLAEEGHYPASTMKVGVMAAAYRMADARELDLDAPVPVHHDFASQGPTGGRFEMTESYDSDQTVWDKRGATVPLRWLLRRMIVRSSNLATNLALEAVGYDAADALWETVGATGSRTRRGMEDFGARDAGIDNVITAADLATLFRAIANGTIASQRASLEMIDVLRAQEFHVDLARGLPEGTPTALKNGWIDGIRHSTAIIYPDDAPAYILSVCVTSPAAHSQRGEDEACALLATIAATSWEARHGLGGDAEDESA